MQKKSEYSDQISSFKQIITMQTSIKLLSNGQPQSHPHPSSADSSDHAGYMRGIFRITVPSFEEIQSQGPGISRPRMRFIMYASIDASGSMGEIASRRGQNNQTKMDFVHMTMKNMVEYIACQEDENPHAEFYLSIVSFDSRANCVLAPCRVSKENKDNIIETIANIKPAGGTNFEKCFQEIAKLMSSETDYIPGDAQASISEDYTTRMHVFLTDGSNNEGDKNAQRLATMLKQSPQKDTMQIMVGYGCDHDSTMLQNLCSQFTKSKQWFIDDVEKTGCIFGDILWCAMNTAYAEVKMSSNVEVYDFNKMSWEREISMDDIIYDSSRTLYIRVPHDASTPTVSCELRYFSIENPSNTSTFECIEIPPATTEGAASPLVIDEDVEKELWRLDTITTIDKALKFLQNIRRIPYSTSHAEKDRHIQEVTTFQEKFLKYVTDKNLSEDPFMIQLADDLYVCINGLMAASIGERYVAARQASQIQQRAVTVNDITPLQVDIISSMPPPRSATQHGYYGDEYYQETDDFVPAAPRRTTSSGGCVGSDTPQPTTPTIPKPDVADGEITPPSHSRPHPTPASETVDEEQTKEDEKIVADFTPSSRGVGSKLRHLSRDAILGYRRARGPLHYAGGDEDDEYYSCGGGGADDTFSSHASPGCARIGRMLSAPTTSRNAPVDRVSTCPY
jgi:von Willebrand factor type A domain